MKIYYMVLLAIMIACNTPQKTATPSVTGIKTIEKDTSNPQVKQGYLALEKFNDDTLKYIQTNFIDGKDYYINKEFGVLLNDLNIPIKQFVYGGSSTKRDEITFTTIKFYTYLEIYGKEAQKKDPVIVNINWKMPLPADKVLELSRKNQMNWTEEVQNYFSKQIVGDISLVRYNFK